MRHFEHDFAPIEGPTLSDPARGKVRAGRAQGSRHPGQPPAQNHAQAVRDWTEHPRAVSAMAARHILGLRRGRAMDESILTQDPLADGFSNEAALLKQHIFQTEARVYDFRAVPSHAEPGDPLYGLYRFKKGFGAELTECVGEYDRPYIPWLHNLWVHGWPLFKKKEGPFY